MRVILASSSSTRRIWMSQQSWMEGHQLEIRSLAYDESVHSVEGDVFDTVREIAIGKADFAIRALADHQDGWVSVVSDTMIEDPDTGLPMGKPRDSIEAERMLRRLSGRRHLVHSCTGVITPSDTMDREMFSNRSQVLLGPLSEDDLSVLLETESWRGKAGGYDIKGLARRHLKIIDGDEVTVLGFSPRGIERLKRALAEPNNPPSGESDTTVF